MTVVTRFAPSPTGFLHIGGARTALFNWLYARHTGGKFLLRIEDTDRKRSTKEAIAAILEGMDWLGLEWDGEPVFQSTRAERHAEVARELLEAGQAYRCYCSPEELAEMRKAAQIEGRSTRYDGRWRDRDPSEAPEGVPPVIRFKAPQAGETVIGDAVQGEVRVANTQLDDMVLLRADGSPTYMLAVVVDDHDMGISHVIRGDDHLNNAFRQANLYLAMGWPVPVFAHVPLIHGPDGAKLSKRHGALGIEAYRDMGYLPEALRNYLLRLGWSHGDDETISTEQAIEWFDLPGIGRSPARIDFDKLANLNGHYLRETPDRDLVGDVGRVGARLETLLKRPLTSEEELRLTMATGELKQRAKTTQELAENSLFYFTNGAPEPDAKAAKLLSGEAPALLKRLGDVLGGETDWSATTLEGAVRGFAEAEGVKLGKVAQPLRAALTGRAASPGIFQVLEVLGREESLARIEERSRAKGG